MSSVGHLVARFQVKNGSDAEVDGVEESQSQTPSGEAAAAAAPATGADEATVAPPGKKCVKKPAPPGKKPLKPPPGVAMRKQTSSEKNSASVRRQGSTTSFTTEDLDLFQRPKHIADQDPPADNQNTSVRRSRKDSIKRSDSQSDKRRSKSVGAFAHGGLRVQQEVQKPKPPSKPKIANKPLVGRPIPASKPVKPSKPPVNKPEPDLPPKKNPVVLRRSKVDGQKSEQPRTSRPVSGVRSSSASSSAASRPISGSRHSQTPRARPRTIVKAPSADELVQAHGDTGKSEAKHNVRLRSPVKTPTGDKAPAVRSRPVSGSRPVLGHTDTARPRPKSRPSSGVSSRTPSYISAGVAKAPSVDEEKPGKDVPKAPPRRGSAKGSSAKRNSSLKQKGKPDAADAKKVVKVASTEEAVPTKPVNQRREQFTSKKPPHVKPDNVPPKPSEKPALPHQPLQPHVSPSVSPKSTPVLPPKISPKPTLLRSSPKSSPYNSPRHSPGVSPAVSPKPTRAKFALSPAQPVNVESKAAARATILSALAGLPSIVSAANDQNAIQDSQVGPTDASNDSPCAQESQEKADSEFIFKDGDSDAISAPDADVESKPTEETNEGSVGDLVKKVEQLSHKEVTTVVEESSNEPKAGRDDYIHEKDFDNVEVKEEVETAKAPEEHRSSEREESKPHHREPGKLNLEKYNEESLNKAIAKAAVGKVLCGPNQRIPIVKPQVPPPPPPPSTVYHPTKSDAQQDSSETQSTDVPRCELTEAPAYEYLSSSPSSGVVKHLKTGLDSKGHDLPVAQLMKELKEVEAAKAPIKDSAESGGPVAKRSPLPLRVFNNEGSPSSSDSERKDIVQSDSNDADDEEEQLAAPQQRHKNQCFVKSFSTGQGDVDSTLVPVPNNRPISINSLASAESASSSDTQGSNKSKSKKSGVLERLRKLSIGLISSENGDNNDASKKAPNSVFYCDNENSKSPTSKRSTIYIGRTKFYSSDNSFEEVNSEKNGHESNGEASNEERNSVPQEKAPLVPERPANGVQKGTSEERPVSEILLENDNYDSSSQPYENIMFGPIYEGIEVQKNKAGRNDLCNSSQSSVEQNSEHVASMENIASSEQSLASTPSPEENANTEARQDEPATTEPVYDQVDELKKELNNETVYENVTFPKKSSNRTLWRRRTLRRKTKKRQRDDDTKGNITEEDEEPQKGFESFSDSEDSFTSDSFTDESDEEEKQGITLYAPLERPKPDEETDVSPMTRLHRIANELLTTERAYVQRLHLIDQVFHFRVVIENRAHHMFPDDVIPQMFSNIKSVYQFHHDFLLPQLEKRMSEWSETPRIGDLMKKFAPFLKLYSEYVKNFDHAMNMISTWTERSQQFANIMSELHKKKECGNLTLQHHMLEPIQRVPRYELLLKDYLKHLPEGSEDEEDTKKALELVTTAASHSNEAMRKIEKFRKLLELNEKFGGTVDLIDPTRELVKEGKITKISARNGLHYERYLFLFNDMLLLCQTHVMGLIHSYRIKNVLEVDGMQVLEGDNLETPYTFYIKSKTKTIEVHTSTAADKMEWFVTIENVIADYTRKQMSRQAGRKVMEAVEDEQPFKEEQLGYRAPTWVKDQNTSMCMECGSPFTMIKRRHHCRCCGIVVCAKCSSQKAPLPYLGGKMDRVCSKCFHTLSGRDGQKMPITNTHIQRKKGVLQVKGSDPSVVSGMLSMSCDKKSWEKRWFALHENYVLYSFKAPQDVHAITSLPLPGYDVEAATKEDHLDRENVIKLFHRNQKKVYYFAPESNNSARWLLCLEYATKADLPPDHVSSTQGQ